ncbi:hypothetical protein RKD23_002542 [Streptomyces sp. SAI-170]
MPEQRERAASPGAHTVRTAPLPDLTYVDLRALRAMDDPGLIAAVDRVLSRAREPHMIWYANPDPDGVTDRPRVRPFSAGHGDSPRGEDPGA